MELTTGEKKFLNAVRKAGKYNGMDFACSSDIKGYTGKQISGFISSLVEKKALDSYITTVQDGRKNIDVCQLIIPGEMGNG